MDRIQQDGFLCFPEETENSVAYRAELHGTALANSSHLIAIVEEWISQGIAIPVQALFISVDRECTIAIDSLAAPELCPSPTTLPPPTTATTIEMTTMDVPATPADSLTVILVVIVVALMLALVTALTVIACTCHRKRCAKLKLKSESM